MIRGARPVAKRRSSADGDTAKAIGKGREAVHHSRQFMLDSAIAGQPPGAADAGPTAWVSRPPVILQVGPRDVTMLAWVRDERDEPVYRIVKDEIKAASTAAMLARKLQQAGLRR